MGLIPPHPPGRLTRKARAFETDIAQLRSQGYTLESIRQALAAAGIQVSLSTVWREASRSKDVDVPLPRSLVHSASPVPAPTPREMSFLDLPTLDPAPAPAAGVGPGGGPGAGALSATLSGKAVAQEFLLSRGDDLTLSIPLPRHKHTKESS